MQRRNAVRWAQEEKALAERRACRLFAQPRATQRRVLHGRAQTASVEQVLLDLANAHPAWGCPQLHRQLRHAGHRINHKRTERLYRENGLSLRRHRRRRLPQRERQSLVQPLQPNRCWSLDFMGDTLANGRAYRTLNVIDDCARDALAVEIDFSLTGLRVVRLLDRLVEWHGRPEIIRSDNGPEFTGRRSRTGRERTACSGSSRNRAARRRTLISNGSMAPTALRCSMPISSSRWKTPDTRRKTG